MGSDIASRGKTLVLYARARAGYGLTGVFGHKKVCRLRLQFGYLAQYPGIRVIRVSQGIHMFALLFTGLLQYLRMPVIHYGTYIYVLYT